MQYRDIFELVNAVKSQQMTSMYPRVRVRAVIVTSVSLFYLACINEKNRECVESFVSDDSDNSEKNFASDK